MDKEKGIDEEFEDLMKELKGNDKKIEKQRKVSDKKLKAMKREVTLTYNQVMQLVDNLKLDIKSEKLVLKLDLQNREIKLK